MVKVKLTEDWEELQKGEILECSKGDAEAMVEEGMAEIIEEVKKVVRSKKKEEPNWKEKKPRKYPGENKITRAKAEEIAKDILKKETPKIEPSKKHFIGIRKILKKYVDTSELNYNFLTSWVLGTHFHSKFETYPLLLLMARKQSGKTRTLKLLSSLSYKSDGSTSTSITETFLFRHKEGALFFDEMESISSREKTALRETINAIYKRGNKIVRYVEKRTCEGKTYVEEPFYPFYPLGIANIYGFGDVLTDRSIQIILQRSNKLQTQLIEDFSTNEEILSLKEELSNLDIEIPKNIFSEWNRFIQKKPYEEDLKEFFETISKTKLTGRSLEIFFPMFIIGEIFDVLPIIIDSTKEYLLQLEGDSLDNPDDLLQDFMDKSDYEGFVNSSKILSDFKNSLEEPEEWMNSKWFGKALKRLGLINKKRLVNGRVQVLLKNNTTYTPNTINSTNSTNSTKEVESVDRVELIGMVDKDKIKVVKIK